MMSARPPKAPTGSPPPMILPESGQVRDDLLDILNPPAGQTESGHHLVEDEQGAVRGAEVAQVREVARPRRDEAHVRRIGLEDDAGDLAPGLAEKRRREPRGSL